MTLALLAGIMMIIAVGIVAYFIYTHQKIEALTTPMMPLYNIYQNKELFKKTPYDYHHMLVSNPALCANYCSEDSAYGPQHCTAWEMKEGDLGGLHIPVCNLYSDSLYNPETDLDDEPDSTVGIWTGASE